MLNLSGISDRTLLGRALRAPLKLLPSKLVMPIMQGALRGKKWIVGASDHGCWLGTYECQKQLRFCQLVSPGDVVFDIGAHAGFYTLLASTLVSRQGRVIAFEPLPTNLNYLRRHLGLNQVDNVEVIAAAVSDSCGMARFHFGATTSTGSLAEAGGLEVETVSLDSLLATRRAPIPQVIKMDIEGGEVRALLGAEALLRTHHPAIFLATHGAELERQCVDYLADVGYRLIPLADKGPFHTDELIALWPASKG